MPRFKPPLVVSAEQQQQIQQWLAAHGTPRQVALRCGTVLAASQGHSDAAIASERKINRKTVTLWRQRFARQGLPSLWQIAAGRGRKPTYGPDKIKAVVAATRHTKPQGMTQWSCRLMASSQGMSKSTISNIWRRHNLKPQRVKTFQLSRHPQLLEKLSDVVGLYLNPPQEAIVLCVDEKSQMQALDRTPPGWPLKKGRRGTMTQDYQRNGTTTLFAALELLPGKVIGQCYQRHRHQEFLKFLRCLDKEFPGKIPLHLVLDNYGTHTQANVKAWLQRHPRFVVHKVPTSSSWLNLIERWFGELTTKRIRRGVFLSVPDLIAAIEEFLQLWNQDPKPFVWTATVESILAKLSGCVVRPGNKSSLATPPRRRGGKENCPVNSWTLH